jgi:hypothetical protein
VRIALLTSFILNRGGTPELRNSSCSELQAFMKATSFFLIADLILLDLILLDLILRSSQNLKLGFLYLVSKASLRRWALKRGWHPDVGQLA